MPLTFPFAKSKVNTISKMKQKRRLG